MKMKGKQAVETFFNPDVLALAEQVVGQLTTENPTVAVDDIFVVSLRGDVFDGPPMKDFEKNGVTYYIGTLFD